MILEYLFLMMPAAIKYFDNQPDQNMITQWRLLLQ